MTKLFDTLGWILKWGAILGFLMRLFKRIFKNRKLKEEDMDLYNLILEHVEKLKKDYAAAAGDGKFTFSEVWAIFNSAIYALVKVTEEVYGPGGGVEKKEVVLNALAKFYDEVIAPIDITAVPNFLEPLADNLFKKLFLELANGSIDVVVQLFKNKG